MKSPRLCHITDVIWSCTTNNDLLVGSSITNRNPTDLSHHIYPILSTSYSSFQNDYIKERWVLTFKTNICFQTFFFFFKSLVRTRGGEVRIANTYHFVRKCTSWQCFLILVFGPIFPDWQSKHVYFTFHTASWLSVAYASKIKVCLSLTLTLFVHWILLLLLHIHPVAVHGSPKDTFCSKYAAPFHTIHI